MTQETPPTSTSADGRVRLNKYLAQCGLGSRRHCDELIAAGRIHVNGQKVTELGTKIDPTKDAVQCGGKALEAVRQHEYYAYYKPKGSLVTRSDPEGRPTIYDDLKALGFDAQHLVYVGRLDWNSEGLLLLTNDGNLVHALTHPRFHIKKVYRVRTNRPMQSEDVQRMVGEGVESEGDILHAGEIRKADALDAKARDEHWYEVDLFEGRNRQIRRMFEGLGYEIVRLKRIQFGSVKITGLGRGEIRPLTDREKSGLFNTGYPQKQPGGGAHSHPAHRS
jgi:pseudouridine synthase